MINFAILGHSLADKKIRDIPLNRFYLLAREVLLQSQEGANHKPQCEYSCDRRYTYLRCREAILAHKYPHRDKTDFEQQYAFIAKPVSLMF